VAALNRSKLLRVLIGPERGYKLARRFEGGLLDGVLFAR
jgi:hypothetical protein